MQKTDYSKIAVTYNLRYQENYLPKIYKNLKEIIQSNNYKNILEAGCGTGRWIKDLKKDGLNVYGLDYSFEMLKIPRRDVPGIKVVNADADFIPYKDKAFDLIFCMNAIHHFPDKEKFIKECARLLVDDGTIAIYGVDPYLDKDWYVYKYFDGVLDNDLIRFPSREHLKYLLIQNGFYEINVSVAEEVWGRRVGEEVLSDPFLQKHSCSQLANLSDEDYQKGINKIKDQIENDSQTVFVTSVIFYLVSAKK